MKRLVSGILAALLAVTAFSACNTNSPASSGDATSGRFQHRGFQRRRSERARYHSVLDFLHRS